MARPAGGAWTAYLQWRVEEERGRGDAGRGRAAWRRELGRGRRREGVASPAGRAGGVAAAWAHRGTRRGEAGGAGAAAASVGGEGMRALWDLAKLARGEETEDWGRR